MPKITPSESGLEVNHCRAVCEKYGIWILENPHDRGMHRFEVLTAKGSLVGYASTKFEALKKGKDFGIARETLLQAGKPREVSGDQYTVAGPRLKLDINAV